MPVVYDLSHIRMPEAHPAGRVRWLGRLGPTLQRATVVVAISEFGKREIMEVFDVPADKIFVAPPGVGPEFSPQDPQTVEAVTRKYGLTPERYFLAVGNLEPRKNLRSLIEAYARLPEAVRASHVLALAGGAGWGDAGLADPLAQSLRRAGRLRLLGYVPGDDLPALYAGAAAFCFPSLYEGFGIPVIEAMACAAPVLASNAASVPEAAGDAALLIDPRDVPGWSEALRRVVEDADLRTRLRAAGPAQAARFTWEACARTVAEALRHAVSAGARHVA